MPSCFLFGGGGRGSAGGGFTTFLFPFEKACWARGERGGVRMGLSEIGTVDVNVSDKQSPTGTLSQMSPHGQRMSSTDRIPTRNLSLQSRTQSGYSAVPQTPSSILILSRRGILWLQRTAIAKVVIRGSLTPSATGIPSRVPRRALSRMSSQLLSFLLVLYRSKQTHLPLDQVQAPSARLALRIST